MKRKLLATRNCRIICVVILASFFVNVTNAIQFTNEFWVSTNTNTANLGTLADPYDGSTAAKFDLVMTNMPSNCVVHILAGTYQTRGKPSDGSAGWVVHSGEKIRGSGIDTTILHVAASAPEQTEMVFLPPGPNTDVEVSDITVDASGNTNIDGVTLFGSRNAIRRVKAVNFLSEGFELFILVIPAGPSFALSEGNIIEECEVSNCLAIRDIHNNPGGISAMELTGSASNIITGVIRNNRVFLANSSTSGSLGEYAFNIGASNLLIEGNYVNGATVGVYSEGSDPNLIVANNVFKNCDAGMRFAIQPENNITFCFNTVELASNSTRGYTTVFDINNAAGTNPVTLTNVVIIGNTLKFDTSQAGGQAYNLSAGNISGLVMCNNSIDSTMTNLITNCTGVNIYNNVDLFGNALTNINQIDPPNGFIRKSLSASYTATYADYYFGMRTMGGVTYLTLPSAVGHAGKEFILANETGSSAVTLFLATAPDTVKGAGGVANPYSGVAVLSDGTNWYVR